ncbi:EAL domain-containing protein (putative c-di-GMP-specific phosphodiesterase class I) [Blastomonas natatoria]|uniref:EAL domain-containing protein (Putative c-di-GMP-specific phosphodiesterase class I) n=1 Tax=Blastomonas natatoria TaxID=34015 RepID=A0A2V3V2P7_9SPHN|nr:bifunctional diguanylate cyclase/phosphodiesterase [Blastomonas natatoria]PXW75078.1 EAL domain-containing protein (putative c-di-GMP-specific phosphodiesterase class I) [Blastomonas natatoria]
MAARSYTRQSRDWGRFLDSGKLGYSPTWRLTDDSIADPALVPMLADAGFTECRDGAVDLLVADLRGAAEASEPALPQGHQGLALLICDLAWAEANPCLLPGWSHALVAPFAPAAVRLQLRMLYSQLQDQQLHLPEIHQRIASFAVAGEGAMHAMLIGLRRMPAVNATYGTAIGDAALEAMEKRLERQATRLAGGSALTLRLAGGDFLVAYSMPEERLGWQVMAERMLRTVSDPLEVAGHRLRLTARAALALAREGETPVSLLDRLSAALANARESAADPVRWADRQSDRTPQSGYRLEQDIVQAIERDEISVLFQPQFAVETGRLVGAEALARWRHPHHGEIGAGTLFALADKADFTRVLSRHIRLKAMQQAAQWTGPLAPLRLSLNVTAEDLGEKDFAKRELAMLSETGFSPWRLTLEMTEQALVPDLKRASARFGTLREAGARIAVDDFGTGYSSLLYLKHLPLDYLKLDHAMTRDIGGAEADRIIVRSIIAMAKALNLKVIAEGVESDAQLAALRDEGCDYFQGFLRGKAMEAELFAEFAISALSPSGER